MKEPKNFEQYAVKKLVALESDLERVKEEKDFYRTTANGLRGRISELEDQLRFVLSFAKPTEAFDKAQIISFKDVWSTHNESDYKRLKQLIGDYTTEKIPF